MPQAHRWPPASKQKQENLETSGMAVRTPSASNFADLDRGEWERKGLGFQLDASFANGAAMNPRKRGRESVGSTVAMTKPQQNGSLDFLSLHSTPLPPLAISNLPQVQSHPPPAASPGLRFSSSCFLPAPLPSDDLIPRIDQQKDEIEQFLSAQGEKLQRRLVEWQRRHSRSLLDDAARLIRGKEAEVERAAKRNLELQDWLVRLRGELIECQAKVMADEVTAASLNAKLRLAAAAAEPSQARGAETTPADDAGSVFVDPNRVDPARACRVCWGRPATTVLLPCSHLCLCDVCDVAAEACPVCQRVKSASIGVFLT